MADTHPPDSTPPSLFRGKLWFWGPIAPLVALDLWSKAAVFAFMATIAGTTMGREYVIWNTAPLKFSFVTWWNTGTIWGLGQSFTTGLIVLRCCALLLIVYFARRLARTARLQQLVLGLIMAGAIGNLYDNFTQREPGGHSEGGVRDFLRFSGNFFGHSWQFPAFNVADSCICIGAFSLAFILWRGPEESPREVWRESGAARRAASEDGVPEGSREDGSEQASRRTGS